MKQSLLRAWVLSVLSTIAVCAQEARPPILGISHICVYASDMGAADAFYREKLGARKTADAEDPSGVRYYFGLSQFAEVRPLPAGQGLSRLDHIAFFTTNAEALRAYLLARRYPSVGPLQQEGKGYGEHWFAVKDPEGNVVQFLDAPEPAAGVAATLTEPGPISRHIIHVGMMVHSREAEDRFYRELLGFRPYWYGAMEAGKVDWVSAETPEGHDWLEYMLVGDGSTTPLDHVNAQTLGGMNHLSLGVANMEQAMTVLIKDDRLSPRHNGPQMGRDGKWQANLFDPDGTRVELMEFQPVMTPCCSAFTAENPAE